MATEKDKETTPATPTEETTENTAQTSAQEPGSALPQTQQELDALIEKRLARERRRLARQQGAQAAPPDEGDPAPGTGAAMPAADAAALAAANRELLIAHAQLDAYRSGVNPAAVEDAVLLAVLQAEKAGEADEDGVRDALAEVLKRHPEWKPGKKDARPGGFKVGVDPGAGAGQNSAGKKPLPSGRVIF